MEGSFEFGVASLDEYSKQQENWVSDEIKFSVATGLKDDTPKTINIAETLGNHVRTSAAKVIDDSTVYWLPKEFSQNDSNFRKNVLAPAFSAACKEAGFRSFLRDTRKFRGKGHHPNSVLSIFQCCRGVYYKKKKTKENENENNSSGSQSDQPNNVPPKLSKKKAQRPIKGKATACKVSFRVYFHGEHKRWYLPKKQAGCCRHSGHPRYMPDQVRVMLRSAGTKSVENALEQLQEFIAISQISGVVRQQTGMDPDYRQIWELNRKRVREQELIDLQTILGDDFDETQIERLTPAERLIYSCQADPTTSYTLLYGDYDDDRLTVYRRNKHGQNRADLASPPSDTTVVDPDELKDNVDSAATYSDKVRQSLSIQGTGQILLGFAWTHTAAQRDLKMFPEFTSADVTEGVNAEKRPLLTFCGKNSYNRSFIHTWAFLPSEAQWVFKWFFQFAVPAIHPEANLEENTTMIITDEDPQATRALDKLMGRTYKNSVSRLCAFHKLNRNFTRESEINTHVSRLRNKNPSGEVEFEMIVQWLWRFVKDYETEEEAEHAMSLLDEYLKEPEANHHGSMGKDLKAKVVTFVNKFKDLGPKLFAHAMSDRPCFDNVTTGINEAEHRWLKHSGGGVKKSDSLATSQAKMQNQHLTKSRKHARQVATDYGASIEDEEVRSDLVKGVTSHCGKLLVEQHGQRTNYCVRQNAEDTFWVKRRPPAGKIAATKSKELSTMTVDKRIHHRCHFYIPKYERTRVVSLHCDDAGSCYARCTCKYYRRQQCACRHIFSIIDGNPNRTHAGVRWWLEYAMYYDRDKVRTRTIEFLRRKQQHGVLIDSSKMRDLTEANEEMTTCFYTCSLNRFKLKDGTYWTRSKNSDVFVPHRGDGVSNFLPMHPIGTIAEVKMSQLSQLTASQSPSEKISFPLQDDDDDENDDDDDDGDNDTTERELKTPTNKNSYVDFLSMYKDVCKRIYDEGDYKEFNDFLHYFDAKLLRKEQERAGHEHPQGSTRMSSVASTVKGKKSKRTKKATSPQSKKKRRQK
jgi:hypothetical protein